MNVTRTAYYSSDYLQSKHDYNYRSQSMDRRAPKYTQLRKSSSKQLPPISQERAFISPEFGAPNDVLDSQNDLTEQMTPAELNHLTKQDCGNSQYRAAYQQSAAENALSGRGVMTHQSFMDNFYNPQPHDLYEPSIPNKYEGYYIDQKRKQNEAVEFQPASYTHKTFQRVFDDEEKPRLNPMDVVFQDKEDMELDRKAQRPPKRLYKNVQRKLARENYVNYDYFKEQQKDRAGKSSERARKLFDKKKGQESQNNQDGAFIKTSEPRTEDPASPSKKAPSLFSKLKGKMIIDDRPENKEVFTDQVDDDDDSTDDELEAWMAEQPGAANTSTPTLRKQIKRKWRKAKRSLEDNYFENYKREIGNRESKKLKEKPQPQLPESPPASDQSSFNPIWNNILSWVVYTPVEEPSESDKIVEISDQSSQPEEEGKRSKKFKQKLLQGWSRPVSLYSKPDDYRLKSRSRELVKSSRFEECGSEYEVEVSDDSDSNERLYYNQETGALEQYNQSALQDMKSAQSAPIQVVSHLNKLIKSVRIMKILFSPIDIIAEQIPSLQSTVIVLELIIFVWILYEVSLLIDALCLAVRAVCAPMIAIGKFMNRVV